MGKSWTQRHIKNEKEKSFNNKKPKFKNFKGKDRESAQDPTYWNCPGVEKDITI